MKKGKVVDDGIFETIVLGAAGVALFFGLVGGVIIGGLWAILIASLVESFSGSKENKEKIAFFLYFVLAFFMINSLIFEAVLLPFYRLMGQLSIDFMTERRVIIFGAVNYFLSTAVGFAGAIYLLFFKKGKDSKPHLSRFCKKYLSNWGGLFGVSLVTLTAIALGIYLDFYKEIPTIFLSKFGPSLHHGTLVYSVKSSLFPTLNIWLITASVVSFSLFIGLIPLLLSSISEHFSFFYDGEAKGNGVSFDQFRKRIEGENEILIGKLNGKKKSLSWRDINHHIQVLGPTGAGKSVLLRNIYAHLIAKNKGILLIDLKGDIEVKSDVARFGELREDPNSIGFLDLNSPETSIKYNPLLRGNANELKDKFMLAFDWSEEYYKKKAQDFMLNIFEAVEIIRDELNELLTLKDVLACLKDPINILHLREKIPHSFIETRLDLELMFAEFKLDKRALSDLSGLRTNFEVLVKSKIGKVICSENSIDLLEVIQNNQVILASLDGQRYGETSAQIARLLVAEIRSCSGTIASDYGRKMRPEFTLMVDEFADIVNSKELGRMFTSLLNKSRSSGIGCVIAHQSLGDFEDEKLKKQVLDNTETLFSFVQKDDETAEKISKMIGTKSSIKNTKRMKRELMIQRNTGEMSVRETEEFLIHPNKIKNLDIGKCVYFAKKPTRFGELSVRFLSDSDQVFEPKEGGFVGCSSTFYPYSKKKLSEEMSKKYYSNEKKNKDLMQKVVIKESEEEEGLDEF